MTCNHEVFVDRIFIAVLIVKVPLRKTKL